MYNSKSDPCPLPRIECLDGFSMSVQAGKYSNYARPRTENAPHYTHVEVGFPSRVEPLLLDYQEHTDNGPMDCCYREVPIEVVLQVTKKHGGIIAGKLPRMDITAPWPNCTWNLTPELDTMTFVECLNLQAFQGDSLHPTTIIASKRKGTDIILLDRHARVYSPLKKLSGDGPFQTRRFAVCLIELDDEDPMEEGW